MTQNLLDSINDVFEQMEGGFELKNQEFDMNSVVESMRSFYQPISEQKEINLEFKISNLLQNLKPNSHLQVMDDRGCLVDKFKYAMIGDHKRICNCITALINQGIKCENTVNLTVVFRYNPFE